MTSVKSIILRFFCFLTLPLAAQTSPTISSLPPRSTVESTVSSASFFTIGDAETAADDLVMSATSSDPVLVPNANIVFGGSGSSRSVTITPATGLRGSTTISLTVTDGDLMTASTAFVFTVLPRYVLPAETIPDLVMTADSSFTLYYKMGGASWTPGVTRSNTTLFRTVGTGSTSDLRLQGTGTDRQLRLRPAPGTYGESNLSITITGDPGGPTTTTFKVTVVPRAIADNLLGVAGRTSTFDVLRNDTQAQPGSSIALQSFTQPANGSLVEGTIPGTLRYTPAPGFSGTDSFTYSSVYNTGDTASATGYVTVQNHLPIDQKHTDLRMNYVGGVWSNEVHADLNFGEPEAGGGANPTILDFDEALLMANPESLTTLSTTLDPGAYSFIGKPLGQPIWNLPQSAKTGVLWPGVSTESIAIGTFASYAPTDDPRATASAPWIRMEMIAYRIPDGARFSMWQSGIGVPVVFWDSIDGVNGPNETVHGNNVSDTFWVTVNTHAHMNWSFTEPGHYQIDCRSRAFVNQGGNLVEVISPVNTIHFMVYGVGDPSTLASIPETLPLPGQDAVTVAANSVANTIAVLANDSSSPDPLEALGITAITQPAHGSASIVSDGVAYQPANGFAGADSFTYTVTDEHGGSATATVQINVMPQTLGAWRQRHYGTTENIGNAANDQDPDGDGVENLLEYAFQLDPTQSSAHLLPQVVLSGEYLSVSFTPPSAVTGIAWGAEWSSTLAADDWHPIPNTGIAPMHLYRKGKTAKDREFLRVSASEQ